VAAAVTAWNGSAWTQVSSTSDGAGEAETIDLIEVPVDAPAAIQNPAVLEQARQARALLQQHHAQVVDLRERTQANSMAYQERVHADLGDRAPKETIAPMPTVAPLEH
jgi:hypothetical protein